LIAGCLIFDFIGTFYFGMKGQEEIFRNFYDPLTEPAGIKILVNGVTQTASLLYLNFVFSILAAVFFGALGLTLSRSRKMDAVLTFLGECWKTLGRPKQIQFDNARELVGWGPAARYLSRVIRPCLRFGVEPIFIPPQRPQYNGSVENFNGWFQPQLLQRRFARPGDLKRELRRLQDTVNRYHAQRRLGGLTAEQYRCRQQLQKLPPRFTVLIELLPIAAGRATFIRMVTPHGYTHLLSQTFWVGKRFKGQYVKAVLDTQRGWLTVYLKGRLFKRWPYKLVNK
jgi:putative transposase